MRESKIRKLAQTDPALAFCVAAAQGNENLAVEIMDRQQLSQNALSIGLTLAHRFGFEARDIFGRRLHDHSAWRTIHAHGLWREEQGKMTVPYCDNLNYQGDEDVVTGRSLRAIKMALARLS